MYHSKGKAHKPYEFGVKASIAVTNKEGFVIGAQSCPGNPYDGYTLLPQLEQIKQFTAVQPYSRNSALLTGVIVDMK